MSRTVSVDADPFSREELGERLVRVRLRLRTRARARARAKGRGRGRGKLTLTLISARRAVAWRSPWRSHGDRKEIA